MEKLKLAAPWTVFYREIKTLFREDPEVIVFYDESEVSIKLYVDNVVKADALTQLLPATKQFGNVTMKIAVIPSNKKVGSAMDLVSDAFSGNEAVSFVHTVENIFAKMTFVVFKKEVVQFFNDDLSDIHGVCSTLYQNIAKDVFGEIPGVFFCTDTGNASLGMLLGEWP